MSESQQNERPHGADPGHPLPSASSPRRKTFHGMACPHCGHRAAARSGHTLTPLYRERTYQCTNHECGHVYIVAMEVLRTVSPSAMPNPNVHIPLSPRAAAACRSLLQTP